MLVKNKKNFEEDQEIGSQDSSENRCLKERPFVCKWDLLYLALLLFLALGVWYWNEQSSVSHKIAHVYVEHEEVLTLDLDQEQARNLPVPKRPSVVLHLDGKGGISFLHSDCPDQICVHAGTLRWVGEATACLPNRVFIRITSDQNHEDEADFSVGGVG